MKSILSTLIVCCLNITCFAENINPNLTAEYNTKKKVVLLKWQNTDDRVTGYILQRSDDNKIWKDIYTLESASFSKKKQEKFSDEYPEPTKNYYRLKIEVDNKNIEYSPSIMVIIGNPLDSWTMYPVPVRDVLNLQYTGSESIKAVVSVFIQNMSGYILTRRRFSSLGRTIQVPVDNLGRGIYDVRIVINDEVIWNQRFVK